ncbi:MAG: GAF domain-containing protein [Myxococcales bacterium FL481]|nr:MAG: GAF domain-containing protein [Myxococcales bacterium FL481]
MIREPKDEVELRPVSGGPDASDSAWSTSLRSLADRMLALESDCREVRARASALRSAFGHEPRSAPHSGAIGDVAAWRHVAANQFYRAATMRDVLRTLRDVLVNFLGVDRFTAFALDEPMRVLFPVATASDGSPRGVVVEIDRHPPLRAMAAVERAWRAGDPDYAMGPELMMLPLVSGARLLGAVRLERFLAPKRCFAESDAALLALVSEYAGIGLECTWTRSNAQQRPLRRETVERLVGA